MFPGSYCGSNIFSLQNTKSTMFRCSSCGSKILSLQNTKPMCKNYVSMFLLWFKIFSLLNCGSKSSLYWRSLQIIEPIRHIIWFNNVTIRERDNYSIRGISVSVPFIFNLILVAFPSAPLTNESFALISFITKSVSERGCISSFCWSVGWAISLLFSL